MLEARGAERLAAADCQIRQIAVWAAADALSDLQSDTARLGVGSRLSAFAILVALAKPASTDTAAIARIEAWLTARLEEQMVFWETAPDGAASGNLRAWAALAGAAVSGLTGDPVIRAWSVWSTRYVLCTASPDGSLPQEMTRGRLALHYQLHALAPLVTSVALLDRQGVALRAECDGALERAARFAMADLDDGAQTRRITGAEQSFFDGSSRLQDFHLAWLEPYIALTGDAQAEALAAPRRPLRYSKLGGDQTVIWRR
nr:alginate lyase family protein [Cognatishimia sp. F0-27]